MIPSHLFAHMHATGHGEHAASMPMSAMMAGMLLGLLVFAALLVAAGAFAGWVVGRRGQRPDAVDDARRELDVRYARGEVDRDTYLRVRSDLISGSA